MKVIQIDKSEWAAGLEKAAAAYRLFGPVLDKGKGISRFKELDKGELPDLDTTRTTLSPKSVTFPHSEVMFEYSTDESREDCNLMKRPPADDSLRAIVGIRPYDAAAMQIVKKNFDTPEYRDPYWCDAYDACTFIGLALNEPDRLDFSTSTGTGPFDTASLDVLLVDSGDVFWAQVVTDKGAAWLEAAGFDGEADEEAAAKIEGMKQAAEAMVVSKVSYDHIRSKSVLDLYEADFWEDATFACLNCGACTYVCPTCWCFDIQEEVNRKSGRRLKTWDSCMFPLFSKHTTGHNPRSSKLVRTRQRFMHKLKYYLDKYEDGIMCVGCGRCVRSCPVNIDIRSICEKMNSAAVCKNKS